MEKEDYKTQLRKLKKALAKIMLVNQKDFDYVPMQIAEIAVNALREAKDY